MSAVSSHSFQGAGSLLSGQSSFSRLSWRADGADRNGGFHLDAPTALTRAALIAGAVAALGFAWWAAGARRR
ncbi:hypothetical protein GCM10009617_12490 [Leifsonia poae]|uniref:Uncharacterized protein n=2 Tax=Leifsonia poae TaxID=110933 RepID=A0A9W6HAU0_9MICO|nr:hypothetical protein GCM10017584_24710 [Leifsonia poae]